MPSASDTQAKWSGSNPLRSGLNSPPGETVLPGRTLWTHGHRGSGPQS